MGNVPCGNLLHNHPYWHALVAKTGSCHAVTVLSSSLCNTCGMSAGRVCVMDVAGMADQGMIVFGVNLLHPLGEF